MILYHSTDEDNADSIMKNGFVGGTALAGEPLVWFSDEPTSYGDTLLLVVVPDDVAHNGQLEYENEPDGISPGGQREYVFSPNVINRYPRWIVADLCAEIR